VLLEEPVNSVKGFIQNLNVGQVNQPDMTLSEFWGKTATMDEQDVLLMKQIENK
jgi:hypothetical protein